MKKLSAIILAAVLAAACSGLGMPFGLNLKMEDFELEGHVFEVTGFKGPYGQQEIGRMHYKDGSGNIISAEFTFKDGKATLVFPGGAYRTVGYTLDTKARTISFDAPITYGCEVRYNGQTYVGEDIKSGKYEMMTAGAAGVDGKDLMFSFFDPSAKTYSDLSLDNQQWGISMVSREKASLTPVYEISGEYGTMDSGKNAFDNGTIWAKSFVYGDALFPWYEAADLSTLHYGPLWCNPSEAQAQWLLDNCSLVRVTETTNGEQSMAFAHKTEHKTEFTYISLLLPPDLGEEYGFWLSNGKALVYKYLDPKDDSKTEARIITPEAGAKYFLFPVKK